MKKSRDFKCQECGHESIRLVEDDVYNIPCTECSSHMQRQLSAPVGSGNSAHGFLKSTRGFN